jgi:hypothetical protein
VQGVVIIGGEGVVYRPNESIGASEPIPNGIALYRMLNAFAVHVICDTGPEKYKLAEIWCKLNGLKDAIVHVREDADAPLDPIEYQWRQIERIRAAGPIWMVLTAFIEVSNKCLDNGIYSIFFNRPGSIGAAPTRQPWEERRQEIRETIITVAESGDEA